MKPGRTAGSCRFETYYKAEIWDPRLAAWRPVQKALGTAEEARGRVPPGQRGRVITISESGRTVGEPFDA